MSNWTMNNRASTTLWTTLSRMNQLDTNFEESGALKISDLTFFNTLSSSAAQAQDAAMIADELDNIFRVGRGAEFEDGVDRLIAMDAMVTVLSDPEKLVMELAQTVDDMYRFWKETQN